MTPLPPSDHNIFEQPLTVIFYFADVEHLDYTDEEYVDLDSPEEEPEERLIQDVSVKMEIVNDDIGSGEETVEASGDTTHTTTNEEEDKEEEDGSGGYGEKKTHF